MELSPELILKFSTALLSGGIVNTSMLTLFGYMLWRMDRTILSLTLKVDNLAAEVLRLEQERLNKGRIVR